MVDIAPSITPDQTSNEVLPMAGKKLVPSGTWKRVSKTLKKYGEHTDLADEERRVAVLTYLKDEPSRDNRMGSTLLGAGASIGGGTSLFVILESITSLDVWWNVGLAALTFATVTVGQFMKLYGVNRDGVGPITAAIVEHRQARRTATASPKRGILLQKDSPTAVKRKG